MMPKSLILLTFCFVSCIDRKNSADKEIKSNTDTLTKIDTTLKKTGSDDSQDVYILHPTGVKDISRFYDTTINDIKLNDCDTIKKLFGDNYNLLPDIDDFPAIQVFNRNESQLLTMYMHNGSWKCDFSQYQVEYTPAKIKFIQKPFKLELDSFKSGNNLYLGMNLSQLKSKIGEPNETRKEDGYTIFSYQQYNDLYFADYYFKKDKLLKFRFGFEYP